MPLYNDLGFYYTPHLTTPSYFSSPFLGTSGRSSGASLGLGLMPVPRVLPRVTPSYTSNLLPSIPEYGSSRYGMPSLDRTTSPRPAVPRYVAPKPVHINTSDIDVSASRYGAERRERLQRAEEAVGADPSRQDTIKRTRTVVRLHTKKAQESPAVDTGRRRLTPGEKLKQKFLILDKAEEEAKAARRKRLEELEERERAETEVSRLQAIAAKRATSDADSTTTPQDGTFAQDPDAVPPVQNFPMIQGLTENAALDILLSTTDDDEERVQGGEISRAGSTGTVKKRKIKEKDGTLKAAKKKSKKKGVDDASSTAEDSPSGDELVEKSALQRRNTVRFRRNSTDVEGFLEIEVVSGSRRSSFDITAGSRRPSFDQTPNSRRSSMDSTGEDIPLASEKKSTVKRKKGPKNKIITNVSVDNSPTREPRSPKFIVDDVKVEQSPASPLGAMKKFRYEVIVEDVEEESTARRRGKSGKENKTEVAAKKKKAKVGATKPLANRQDKSATTAGKTAEVKTEGKETMLKSFQKSRPEPAQEAKTLVEDSKTEEIIGKITQQKNKENVAQEMTPKIVTSELSKKTKLDTVDKTITKVQDNELQDTKKDNKEKPKHVAAKDRKLSKELDLTKLSTNDIQKGRVAVDKPKPTTLASVVPKVEDSKLGKLVVEKSKANKRQADPIPAPLTPTLETGIQKSESGINFWDFLNGLEEEKEIKKPFITKVEPVVSPGAEKLKVTKMKPDLHLNIENKIAPTDKRLEASESESKTSKIGTKVTDQKEPKKVDLPLKRSEEKIPKWKALEKDRSKTPETPGITDPVGIIGVAGKKGKDQVSPTVDRKTETPKPNEKEPLLSFNTNQNQVQSVEITSTAETKVVTDDVKKELVRGKAETPTASLPKAVETRDKKPVSKWKGFGKDPSSPASAKEEVLTPNTLGTPKTKNSETKVMTQVYGTFPEVTITDDVFTTVLSPSRDAADGSEESPTTPGTPVAPETPKVSDQKVKPLWGPQQKEISAVEDKLKNNILKKEAPSEGDLKPVPKWKVKAIGDEEVGLKKPPLSKIKQSSSDSSLIIPTEPKVKTEVPSLTVKTSLSDPVTPTNEKEKSIEGVVKSSSAAEIKIEKPEPKTLDNTDKPPKKPLAKNKVAEKQPETSPTPATQSNLTRQLEEKVKKEALQSAVISDNVTTKDLKEEESKKGSAIENPKDNVPSGKPNITQQKIKEEEKNILTPFGKKVKVPELKVYKKEEIKSQDSDTKKEKLITQKEETTELVSKNKIVQKTKDAVDEKSELKSPAKKVGKLVGQKSKDEDKSEPPTSPLKKAIKPVAQKGKEESESSSPDKKGDKLTTKKSDDSGDKKKDDLTPVKKGLKPFALKSKDEEKIEPQSTVKKGGKLTTQKSKEEDDEPSSPVKKLGKLVPQKSKEDLTEPPSPVKKPAKLLAQKSKDEEASEPSSPVKKNAKLLPQKSKEDEKKDTATPPKKGAKLVAQKSKEDPAEAPSKAKKTTSPVDEKPKTAKKMEEDGKVLAAPTALPAPESGSEADSEDSSSEDEGDTTPRASSSSCSSSDSGFDSRPSSVPVPSTASEASSREPGCPSPALSCSPLLDPYSEDAGPPRGVHASGRTTPPAHSLPRFRKYTVDDFQFLKLLGKGTFGKVLLAELRGTDRHYAVKCLKKDVVLEDDDVECTLIERKVLALGTKHPYLCHLFCTFQTESHLLFVMEYLNGGDLMFHIQQSGRFQEHRARFYAAEIVCGLKFLHKKGIVYRDLKLDNILLDYEGHVRIADFGMCKLQIFLDRTADTFCGTPDYMAPEIIKGLKYNQCVDWWSFGVLVFEMVVGVSPFSGCDEDELFWSICNDQPQYPRFLSREAHSLLTSLLEKDAQKRLGTPSSPKGDVPDHVFFRSIDWDALERRELDPPFRPRVKHPLDVQYFDAAFTAERAELTPVDASILQSMDQAQFQGFSYTNPNATD